MNSTGLKTQAPVVITGAAGGIGRATCAALASRGARLWVTDLDEDGIRSVCSDIENAGGHASGHVLDVGDSESWRRLASTIGDRSPLSGLVNCAGISLRRGLSETTVEQWNTTLATNLSSVFFSLKFLSENLAAAEHASVVNVSSIAGLLGWFDSSYAASKWGVRGISKSAALELAPHGIRVNSVHPGMVGTPMLHQKSDTTFVDTSLPYVPAGRVGTPAEIADMIVFLLSQNSSYVNGVELVVDGGLTAAGLYHRIIDDVRGKRTASPL